MLARALALAAFLLYAGIAGAQFSGTLAVVSDYRFRGISLSRQKPAVQATLNYDDPSGWYAGLFASTVEVAGEAATTGQGIAYLGVVAPIGGGFNWEVGGEYSAFSDDRDYNYAEVYTGVTARDFNARLHYSANYFGSATGSFYLEGNVTHSLSDHVALIGHVGVLVPTGSGSGIPAGAPRNPLDGRVGLSADVAGFNLEVAWVGTNGTGYGYPVYGYPGYGSQRRNTVVFSISRSF